MQTPPSLASAPAPSRDAPPSPSLEHALAARIRAAGGWIGFEDFMAQALYAPGQGYYARDAGILGRGLPAEKGAQAPRGDFVTAPELGPWFGRALAVQVGQALAATGTHAIWEFGAGSGALASHLLDALGDRVAAYHIVELSAGLRARQQQTLQPWAGRVTWEDALPPALEGVVVGNEVLDAMPVTLLMRRDRAWHERGVALDAGGGFAWSDKPTALQPSLEPAGEGDYLTEIHPQAEAFVRTLAERLVRGAAFFIDYGFPEREYYHPQRAMGTLACHRAHRVDHDPLADVGAKDITAHVNFTGIALAAQAIGDTRRARGEADIGVLGYTSQARFLLNCGIADMLQQASWQERALANALFMEHEMGELFKVIGFYCGEAWDAVGFAHGDRCHTL